MPVTVFVRAGGPRAPEPQDKEPSLTFDGPRVVIGRSDGSDVRLPDPSVSLRHASIRAQGSDYAIVDEGSTNGTWVGGVKLLAQTPRLVRSGDLVRVGKVWLELVVGQRPATPDLGLATRDLALALVRRAMEAAGDDTSAVVRVAEGPDIGAELRLREDGRTYLFGRAEHCDLPLADEDASREHAAIVRRGGRVFLRDLGSRNGVFVGETRLAPDQETVWRPPAMARIGISVLSLEEPVSRALAELEAAADEPLPDAAAPPAPVSVHAPPPPEPEPEPPPPVAPAGARVDAAIAPPLVHVPAARARPKRTFTVLDIVVVTVAIAVIGASLATLVWVLR